MAKTATLHMRIDADLKQDAECYLNELGMSTAEAVSIFLKQVILNRGLPFEIKLPNYDEGTLNTMEESNKIIQSGSSRFNSLEEMFNDLEI